MADTTQSPALGHRGRIGGALGSWILSWSLERYQVSDLLVGAAAFVGLALIIWEAASVVRTTLSRREGSESVKMAIVILTFVGLGALGSAGLIYLIQTQPRIVSNSLPAHAPGSAAIKVTGGSVDMKHNIVSGFDTVVDATSSNVAMSDNYIERTPSGNLLPSPTGEFKNLTSQELKKNVVAFGNSLRADDTAYSAKIDDVFNSNIRGFDNLETDRRFKERSAKLSAISDAQNADFQKRYLSTARSLASEILSRIPSRVVSIPRREVSATSGGQVVRVGILAGPHPLEAVADFLDYLTSQLPSR